MNNTCVSLIISIIAIVVSIFAIIFQFIGEKKSRNLSARIELFDKRFEIYKYIINFCNLMDYLEIIEFKNDDSMIFFNMYTKEDLMHPSAIASRIQKVFAECQFLNEKFLLLYQAKRFKEVKDFLNNSFYLLECLCTRNIENNKKYDDAFKYVKEYKDLKDKILIQLGKSLYLGNVNYKSKN